jgi:glycosyltransferase involved in cell wall biosynthesis
MDDGDSFKPVLSIITAIHNGITLNKVFWESLSLYTVNKFELIVIDNASTDGSIEFFEKKGAVIIRNSQNFAYSYCQNQGLAIAKGKYLCFFNNDLLLSPKWDERLIHIATKHELDVFSASGIENTGDYASSRQMEKKWKRVKYPLLIFRLSISSLKAMISIMYGNWVSFCERRYAKYGTSVVEGIVGNNVVMTQKAISMLGGWDTRIQAADFDIFMTIKKMSIEKGGIKPCHIALGVFIHHYGRMTSKYGKTKYKPFANESELIDLETKWTKKELTELHPDNATKLATNPKIIV